MRTDNELRHYNRLRHIIDWVIKWAILEKTFTVLTSISVVVLSPTVHKINILETKQTKQFQHKAGTKAEAKYSSSVI